MPEPNDIVQINIETIFNQEKGENVFFYNNLGLSVSMFEVLKTIELAMIPKFNSAFSNTTEFTNVRGRNLFDPTEAEDLAISATGASGIGGTDQPPYFANELRFNHDDGTVRTGLKRCFGMTEDMTDDGLTVTPATKAILDNVADLLVPSILTVLTNDGILAPVTVGMIKVSEGVYRLPETQAEALARGFGFWSSGEHGKMTTQNSRKPF